MAYKYQRTFCTLVAKGTQVKSHYLAIVEKRKQPVFMWKNSLAIKEFEGRGYRITVLILGDFVPDDNTLEDIARMFLEGIIKGIPLSETITGERLGFTLN